MSAPKGNKYAKGNKGGRRPSAYQEQVSAETLAKMFLKGLNENEKEKLLKGKHSIKDVMISKAFAGNERFIQAIFNKLFPDNLNVKSEENKKITFELDEKTRETIQRTLSRFDGDNKK